MIETESETLRYAGAGHPPLLVRDGSSGEVRTVLENGLFLGFFRDVTYANVEVPFRKGDWALLFTDGISEMMNTSEEQFGLARLESFLREQAAPPAADLAGKLLQELDVWSGRASGREPDDDVTLLVVHFQGGEAGSPSS